VIVVSTCASSAPQNFHQKHLRNSRSASDSSEIQKRNALGRLAARISGRDIPLSSPPSSDQTLITEEQLLDLISRPYSSESLNRALLSMERLPRQNHALNKYIALCYWHTGQTIKAVELGNSILRELESPEIRKILYSQAISERNYDLALHHLEKTGLSKSAALFAKARLLIKKADLPLVFPVLLFLATLAGGMKLATALFKKRFINNVGRTDQTILKKHATSSLTEDIREPTSNTTNDVFADSVIIADHYLLQSSVARPINSAITENCTFQALEDAKNESLPEDRSLVELFEPPLTETSQASLSLDKETLKTLFVSLQLSLSQHMIRMISIASESRSALKARLALKLGSLFAENDYKTLLLDCNNTGTFLHEELGIKEFPGISDLADPDCEFTSVFRASNETQLFYVTCGMQPAEADSLPASAWELLLDYCRKNYEIIILILPETEIVCQNISMISNTVMLILDDEQENSHQSSFTDIIKSHPDIKLLGRLSSVENLSPENML